MVDNRSTGLFGLTGGFNFKSGDASGMANKTQDDKMGQGGEYFAQGGQEPEEEKKENIYVDRSAQLRGALDSLAVMNALRIKKMNILSKDDKTEDDEESEEKKKRKSKKELSHLVDDFEKNN